MAFNSFNPTINSLRIENKSQSKQIKFSSKKICFKKSWNGLNLNNNNNNIYCNYNNNNENNNCFKSDSKEQKLNSIQLKSSVENVVENVVEMTSNKDFIQTDMSFSSPGMKDVPQWLKVLRLHKYANLFSSLTYEELLNITEEELSLKNVTQGARHKLLLSIEKLRNRPKILKALEKDMIEEGFNCLKQSLIQINNMLSTPFKQFNVINNGSQLNYAFNTNTNHLNSIQTNSDSNLILFIANDSNEDIDQQMANKSVNNCDTYDTCVHLSDEDLPEIFTRLLGIVYAILITTSNTDDDSYNLFNCVIDKCIAHEAFNSSQKSRLNIWKQSIHKIWTSNNPYRRSSEGRLTRSKWSHSSVCNTLSNGNTNKIETKTKTCNSSSQSTAGSVVIRKHCSSFSSNNSLSSQKSVPYFNEHFPSDGFESQFGNVLSPNLQNQLRPRTQLYRTHSAPVGRSNSQTENHLENHFLSLTYECDQFELNDIEKLCIRMTEQALGLSDGGLLHHNNDHDL